MKRNKYRMISLMLVVLLFSLTCSPGLFAQPETHEHGHEHPVAPIEKPESEGSKRVASLKFEPLSFAPPLVDRIVLKNGMIIYLLEDHDLPIVNVVARIRTGAIYEPSEKAGLASLTGHVMRSGGTLSMSADVMNEELEFMAASVETGINREQGDATLSVLKKDLDKGLKIFADVLMNPAFPEEKIWMRKDEVIETIRRENDNPSQIAQREFRRIIYDRKHPYNRKVEGTLESIERITRDDMVAFHKKYFYPDNIILGISGDFQREEIIKKLHDVFAGWKKGRVQFPVIPKVERQYEREVHYVYKDINQSNILMGHLGIQRKDPDYFPVMIMNFILGGGSFKARIMSRIRSDEGLAYSAFSAFQPAQDIGVFFVSCQTKLESTNRAISIALEEINKMRTEAVDQEELTEAKETFMNQFIFRFARSSHIIAQKIDIEYEGLPLNYLETYLDEVKAVTQKDIQRVAKKYLHPDKIKILVVGNKEKFDKQLDNFGKVNVITLQ
ncbi:MAG: insulinase family protein [wastewater metagenome]|nr:insulinase family protein [Candidatus Loosdrechtia aerotolerans]